jgi:lysophospholipase L1-like esterase
MTTYYNSIVCIGDSITAGGTTNVLGIPVHYGWPYRLAARMGQPSSVIDKGVAGDTSGPYCGQAYYVNLGAGGDMLTRFDTDVIALHPAFVIILAGTNDIYRYIYGAAGCPQVDGVPYLTANITTMCAKAEAANIKPVLATITPYHEQWINLATNPHTYGGWYDTFITEANIWITAFAAAQGYYCIDFHSAVEDPANPGHMIPAYLVGTGYPHPNALGHQAMADCIDISQFEYDGTVEEITATFDVNQNITVPVGWNV